jgi:hypothetical protein
MKLKQRTGGRKIMESFFFCFFYLFIYFCNGYLCLFMSVFDYDLKIIY